MPLQSETPSCRYLKLGGGGPQICGAESSLGNAQHWSSCEEQAGFGGQHAMMVKATASKALLPKGHSSVGQNFRRRSAPLGQDDLAPRSST